MSLPGDERGDDALYTCACCQSFDDNGGGWDGMAGWVGGHHPDCAWGSLGVHRGEPPPPPKDPRSLYARAVRPRACS